MKTLVLSMISIAATLAAMTACTSESDPIDEAQKNAQTEIKLSAGVINVETKAQITPTPITGTSFTQTVKLLKCDVETDATARDWTLATDPKDTPIAGTKVTLDNTHKYYVGEKYTYFIGYYPEGSYSSGIVSYTGLSGISDIICTDETNVGSKASPEASPSLKFKHMLSQVQIQIQGDLAAQAAFGAITKIELLNIPTALDLTLGTNASIAQKGADVENITIFEGSTTLSGSVTPVGAVPMIFNGGSTKFGTSSKPLTIQITYGSPSSTANVDVKTMTTGLEQGKKHIITLNFKEKIDVEASLADWDAVAGEGGSGEVE